MNAPLADRIRPKTLDDVVGQQHILGPNKVLRRIIESGTIPNMVFYGPSGVGKTTVASIIAKQSHMHLCKLNGTTASTADIRDVVAQDVYKRQASTCVRPISTAKPTPSAQRSQSF